MARPQQLVLVDTDDQVTGSAERLDCHAGEGLLHRAFSILIFDAEGRVLLQKRSAEKQLWPGFWSNTCCGHPLRGEAVQDAAHRRLEEEFGFRADLDPLFKFQYAAPFEDRGWERELCAVFVGRYSGDLSPAPEEISAWEWSGPGELSGALEHDPTRFTPWFRFIWRVLGLPRAVWEP